MTEEFQIPNLAWSQPYKSCLGEQPRGELVAARMERAAGHSTEPSQTWKSGEKTPETYS